MNNNFKYYHYEEDTSGIVSSEQHYVLIKLHGTSWLHNMLQPINSVEGENKIVPLVERVYHLLSWEKKVFIPDPMTGLYGKDIGGRDVSSDVIAVCEPTKTPKIDPLIKPHIAAIRNVFVPISTKPTKPNEPLQFLKYPENKPSTEPHRCYVIPYPDSSLYATNESFPMKIDTLSGQFFVDGKDISDEIMLFNDDEEVSVWRV